MGHLSRFGIFGRICVALLVTVQPVTSDALHSVRGAKAKAPLTPVPLLGRWDWSTCRIAPPLVDGDEKLLVFTSVFVGRHCASVTDSDVIPSTHLTPDRLPSLLRLVRAWTTPRRDRLHRSGCVSVSFGAEDPDALLTLRETLAGAADLAEHMLVHVVIGSQSPYPFNVHRNTAMEPWNSAALFASRPFSWIRYADELDGSPRAPTARPPARPGAPEAGLEALVKQSHRNAFFTAAQSRVRYPYGLWLDDEGPPPPLLLQGTGGPGDTCVVVGGPNALPLEYAVIEDEFVAATRRSKFAPSPRARAVGRRALAEDPPASAEAGGLFEAPAMFPSKSVAPSPLRAEPSPDAPPPQSSPLAGPGAPISPPPSAHAPGARHYIPRPWVFTLDVDALPSGNADEFADAISAGLRAKAADGVSASLAGAGVSQEIIPCLDGTSPLFVVPPFSPVPRGLNAKRAADEVIESFLSPELRHSTDSSRMKHWLNLEISRDYVTFFGDLTRCYYQGTMDVAAWLRYGAPAATPLRYAPNFEPYFIAHSPLPPFDEFYRGRGNDKTSWFFPNARCDRFSLHLLGDVFVVSDLRDDNSRGKDAVSRKDRPDNRLHMKLFLQRLGAKIICLPNSGDCFFAQHAVPSMSGRGRGRKESLGPEEILESANAALKLWPNRPLSSAEKLLSITPTADMPEKVVDPDKAATLAAPVAESTPEATLARAPSVSALAPGADSGNRAADVVVESAAPQPATVVDSATPQPSTFIAEPIPEIAAESRAAEVEAEIATPEPPPRIVPTVADTHVETVLGNAVEPSAQPDASPAPVAVPGDEAVDVGAPSVAPSPRPTLARDADAADSTSAPPGPLADTTPGNQAFDVGEGAVPEPSPAVAPSVGDATPESIESSRVVDAVANSPPSAAVAAPSPAASPDEGAAFVAVESVAPEPSLASTPSSVTPDAESVVTNSIADAAGVASVPREQSSSNASSTAAPSPADTAAIGLTAGIADVESAAPELSPASPPTASTPGPESVALNRVGDSADVSIIAPGPPPATSSAPSIATPSPGTAAINGAAQAEATADTPPIPGVADVAVAPALPPTATSPAAGADPGEAVTTATAAQTVGETVPEGSADNRAASVTATPPVAVPVRSSPKPSPRRPSLAAPVQIVMSDVHELSLETPLSMAEYPAISAVINLKYAKRHGYAFTFFVMHWVSSAAERMGIPKLQLKSEPPACYHAASKSYRHTAWTKILACWAVASESDPSPSWAVYLDSDSIVNNQSLSVDTFIEQQRKRKMVSGPPIDGAIAAFANDLPSSPGKPNSGTFLFRRGVAAAAFFTHWWDAPARGFAMERPWEQGSLWSWFNASEWGPHVAVLDTPTFTSITKFRSTWLRHHAGDVKAAILNKHLRADAAAIGIGEAQFASLLREVVEKHTVHINVLDADARVSAALPARSAVSPLAAAVNAAPPAGPRGAP